MAPKKAPRRNNKKKGGKSTTVDVETVASEDSLNTSDKNRIKKNFFRADEKKDETVHPFSSLFSEEEADEADEKSRQAASDTTSKAEGGGLYASYKRATQLFKEGLFALVPTEIYAARDSVQNFMDAVDYLIDQKQTINPTLLKHCRKSLQFRKRYSKSFVDGGDEGHSYFILVLQYCCQRLKQLVSPSTSNKKPVRKQSTQQQFRFTDYDIESDEDDEEGSDVTSTTPVRPPAPTKDYTMDNLVDGTDHCQAKLFLSNVDKCMEVVSKQYASVKEKARLFREQGIEDASLLIGPLMTAAAVTNFSIRHVQRMEEELKLDFPHLTTVYRVLACVCLKSDIDKIHDILKISGATIPRSELTAFVGDIVEQGFRVSLDEYDRSTKEFCKKWRLPFNSIVGLVGQSAFRGTIDETRPFPEAVNDVEFHELPGHVWLQDYKYIGGPRCILNTLSLIQQMANQLRTTDSNFAVPKGRYGELWDEQKCLAKQIQGDMDQLLMENIMPALLVACKSGYLSQKIFPWMNELLPFVKNLRQCVSHPQKLVTMSLSFGVHAILTSIFELQGDSDVANIAEAAQNAHRVFFEQVDDWIQHSRFNGLPSCDRAKLNGYRSLPVSTVASEISTGHGHWNPYCAGMFLNHLSLGINVPGVAFMNSRLQLQVVLHLYNAFQQRELIADIPLLNSLDAYIGSIPRIWGSEKATRENFVSKFWVAYGLKGEFVRAIHEDCRRIVLGTKSGEISFKTRDGRFLRRSMTQVCRAGDVSKVYQKICREDFQGIMDGVDGTLDKKEVAEAYNWEWYMSFERYVNDIVVSMAREEELLSWNFLALADSLECFVLYLVDQFDWQKDIDEFAATACPNGAKESAWARFAILARLANHVLGPLELVDTVEGDLLVTAVRDLMVEYFENLKPSKYTLFNAQNSVVFTV